MRLWLLWSAVTILLFACAKPPPPPPIVQPDPQLELAIRLAEHTVEKIVAHHVTPVERDRIMRQFAIATHDSLQRHAGPGSAVTAKDNIDDIIRGLHQQFPQPSILDAVESALAKITRGLDNRNSYLDREQTRALTDSKARATAATGVVLRLDGRQPVINEVIADSPADRAGLKAGDKVLGIDDESVSGKPLEWIVTKLRGKPGSMVALTIEFADGDNHTLRLKREKIALSSVEGRWLTHGIAYVRIRSLMNSTVIEFNKTFLGLVGKVGAPRGLILDLRNNTGGLLHSAVQLTDIFLERGTILKIQGRASSEISRFVARPKSEVLEKKLPIVVLINANTAAGAESIAAALQDHHRAVLIGNRSSGIGLVHSVYMLPGKRALKLATDYLYRPSGELIEKRGVLPHVCVTGKSPRIIRRTNVAEDSDRACRPQSPEIDEPTDISLQLARRILTRQKDYRQLIMGTLGTLSR